MTMPSAKPAGINTICNDNKKASKPLIEKRRRARINSSLAELKTIVVGNENSNLPTTARPPKLEKADILEMTVAFVKKKLQAKQSTRDLNEYSIGYDYCLKEVCQFLEEEGNFSVKSRLLMHLNNTQHVLNNPESGNNPTDDSMSCSSNSRSHTPSTVSTDNCLMEYSSTSPFTDTEQEVPSTLRTFSTDRHELGMDRNSMERLVYSPNSCQEPARPLNLALSSKNVPSSDFAIPSHSRSDPPLQPQFRPVQFEKPTCDCGRDQQASHMVQSHDFQRQVECCSGCSSCVWRPW